jgi:hypothetical protein
MKRLALLIFVAGAFAGMALASDVTLSLHTTNDTPIIDLSTILNQWGTPSDSADTFTIGGTGTDKIFGLNLVNDTGLSITSIALFAYGTVGSNTFGSMCVNDSGSPFTSCTAPASQNPNTTISMSSPIEWNYFGGGSIAPSTTTEFRLVDTSTATGTDLFYEIEINGNPPTTTPEPTTIPFLAGGLILMGWAFRRKLNRVS